MPVTGMKVPLAVATGIICFVGGGGAVVLAMPFFGYHLNKPIGESTSQAGGMMMGGGGGMGGRPGGAGAMGGGRGGPSARGQLAALVVKPDQLTRQPLTIRLNDAQRTKLREQLQGLEENEALTDEEAKKRFDAVLEIVKGDQETLVAAGFRWPGQRAAPPSMAPPSMAPPGVASNPFKQAINAEHLRSLRGEITKTTAK